MPRPRGRPTPRPKPAFRVPTNPGAFNFGGKYFAYDRRTGRFIPTRRTPASYHGRTGAAPSAFMVKGRLFVLDARPRSPTRGRYLPVRGGTGGRPRQERVDADVLAEHKVRLNKRLRLIGGKKEVTTKGGVRRLGGNRFGF